MSNQAEAAFEAWWKLICADGRIEWFGVRQGYIAGHASRDSEVAALRNALQALLDAQRGLAHCDEQPAASYNERRAACERARGLLAQQ